MNEKQTKALELAIAAAELIAKCSDDEVEQLANHVLDNGAHRGDQIDILVGSMLCAAVECRK